MRISDWSSDVCSSDLVSHLMFRYYFQALMQHQQDARELKEAAKQKINQDDWLESITSLNSEEALLWLTSTLTLTCAFSTMADMPAWTTAQQVRLVLEDHLRAISKLVKTKQVQIRREPRRGS